MRNKAKQKTKTKTNKRGGREKEKKKIYRYPIIKFLQQNFENHFFPQQPISKSIKISTKKS